MDLNAPLGVNPPPKPPRRRGPFLAVAATLVAAGAVATVGFFLLTADPHGGEPYGVASIPPAAPKPRRAAPSASVTALDPTATASIAQRPVTITPIGSGPASVPSAATKNGPLIIDVAKVLAERQGFAVVSPPMPAQGSAAVPAMVDPEPRVAIFVGGMGLSDTATRTATEIMPAAVTLAFVPYGETAAAAVAAAKARGHEILLQVPMRNGPGAAAPGPHALRPGEAPQEVAEDAAWLMGRFQDYDGVTNLLGAPVTADRQVLGALLKIVAARGLFYVDDGTSRRSLAPLLAPEAGLTPMRADVVLDATADPAVVRANLEALVAIAKQKGSAVGMASGLPDHLATIAAFASQLAARSVKLVPVGALVARNASVAVAR